MASSSFRRSSTRVKTKLGVSLVTLATLAAGCGGAHRSTETGGSPRPAVIGSPTTSAAPTTLAPAAAEAAADKAAISRYFAHVNAQYGVSPQAGYMADVASDYFVTEGLFTSAECTKYWLSVDGGYLMVERVPITNSIIATPRWRPSLGSVPSDGRVYAMTVRIREWPAGTDSSHAYTGTKALHVLVLPNGAADLFVPCAATKGA